MHHSVGKGFQTQHRLISLIGSLFGWGNAGGWGEQMMWFLFLYACLPSLYLSIFFQANDIIKFIKPKQSSKNKPKVTIMEKRKHTRLQFCGVFLFFVFFQGLKPIKFSVNIFRAWFIKQGKLARGHNPKKWWRKFCGWSTISAQIYAHRHSQLISIMTNTIYPDQHKLVKGHEQV